jgi:hypothetical protein
MNTAYFILKRFVETEETIEELNDGKPSSDD